MLQKLMDIQAKKTHRVIGLMSGTSADGVDACLCEISGEGRGGLTVKLLAKHAEPYPEFVRDRVLRASDPKGGGSAEICELNFLVGEIFAHAANTLLETSKVDPAEVDLIGSHGQTISHVPPRTEAHSFTLGATLQIGEPAVIAERTGIMVVSNFRTRDIAAGGQGAPLVPFVDYLLFSSSEVSRVALNIGGISNLTYLPAHGGPEATLAYDSGPGNMIVDAIVQYMTQGESSYDRDGELAASGTVQPTLLNEMLTHEFLQRPPPKSTGREDFGIDYAMNMYESGKRRHFSARDIIATATAFTASTIVDSVRKFVLPRGALNEIIVSGGGALNPVLMKQITGQLPDITLVLSDQYGLPIKAKESIAFAVLGRETALGRPSNLPSATGAKGPRILGQITPV